MVTGLGRDTTAQERGLWREYRVHHRSSSQQWTRLWSLSVIPLMTAGPLTA